MKTWISEETGPAMTIEALMSVVQYFALTLLRARIILREVHDAVGRWRTCGAALGMSDTELDQYAEAFEHDETASARSEGGRG